MSVSQEKKDDGDAVIINDAWFRNLEHDEFVICFNKKEENQRNLEFLCCACNKHLKSVQNSNSHCKSSKHIKELPVLRRKLKSLRRVPFPSKKQEAALTDYLTTLLDEIILTDSNITVRQELCKQVETTLHEAGLKGVFCRLYGSSLTGIGFKDSGVDIDIQCDMKKVSTDLPKISSPALLYLQIVEILKRSSHFCDVFDLLHTRASNIKFTHVESGLQCCISSLYGHGFHLGSLIRKYVEIDKRVKIMCLLFKFWAKFCEMDNAKDCGLSPYCFTLMTLHYLQHTEPPVVPVIRPGVKYEHFTELDWEDERNGSIDVEQVSSWQSMNQDSIGKLWTGLLRYYTVDFRIKSLIVNIRQLGPLARMHKQFGYRRLAVEDPFLPEENIASTMFANNAMTYFTNCLENSLRYFSCFKEKKNSSPGDFKSRRKSNKSSTKSSKKQTKEETADEQHIKDHERGDTQEDESDDDDDDDDEVIIESDQDTDSDGLNLVKGNEGVTKEDDDPTKTNNQVDHVDAGKTKIDEESVISHVVSTDQSDEQLEKVMDASVAKKGSSLTKAIDSNEKLTTSKLELTNMEQILKETEDLKLSETGEVEIIFSDSVGSLDEASSIPQGVSSSQDHAKLDTVKGESVEKEIDLERCKKDRLVITTLVNDEDGPIPDFRFQSNVLNGGTRVPLICAECWNDGHIEDECPFLHFGFKELEPLTENFVVKLDRVCASLMAACELKAEEFQLRLNILKALEDHLKQHFKEDCRLSLFGSSVNGFGFEGSDMDICLRFPEDEAPAKLNKADMVVKISKAMDKHPQFHKVMYIKSAKVPIVKFEILNTNLEGDISLYNTLALHNSRMLATYASIDKRVRTLGYCLKVFAKYCEIGDASRGSLSSYSYILLILFYLQRCNPPVIPVLQELYNKNENKPERMVEGWNTWYYSDLENLPKVWPGVGKNTQSVGELWIGFFRFYLEKFDFNRNVVAIRQTKRLTKFEKSWTRATIAIEDPFNLNHNLGAGIRRNMYRFVMTCFINARFRFGSSKQKLPKTDDDMVLTKYFFDARVLTGDKDVPKDRLCRRCGRIGHIAAVCAEKIVERRDRRKRLDSEKDERMADPMREETKEEAKHLGKQISKNADIICFVCKKKGHRKVDCPERDTGGKKISKAPGAERRKEQKKNSSTPVKASRAEKQLTPRAAPKTQKQSSVTATGSEFNDFPALPSSKTIDHDSPALSSPDVANAGPVISKLTMLNSEMVLPPPHAFLNQNMPAQVSSVPPGFNPNFPVNHSTPTAAEINSLFVPNQPPSFLTGAHHMPPVQQQMAGLQQVTPNPGRIINNAHLDSSPQRQEAQSQNRGENAFVFSNFANSFEQANSPQKPHSKPRDHPKSTAEGEQSPTKNLQNRKHRASKPQVRERTGKQTQ